MILPFPEREKLIKQLELGPVHFDICYVNDTQDTEKSMRICKDAKELSNDTQALRDQLESLLTIDEVRRLADEYFRDGKPNESYSHVSVEQCRLWVSKRAYELGWSAELFPYDHGMRSSSRHSNDYERIGKKYQRIALDEIQARLADNFWVLSEYPREPCVYRYSHHDCRRNLDPTILPTIARTAVSKPGSDNWIVEPIIKLPDVAEDDLREWPFVSNPIADIKKLIFKVDSRQQEWVSLYEFNLDERTYERSVPGEHNMRYNEFRFIFCVFVKRGNAQRFVELLKKSGGLERSAFEPPEFANGPYLGEAFWRNTWRCEKFGEKLLDAPSGYEFAIPILNYRWEYDNDRSLVDGFSTYIPRSWFAKELNLSLLPNDVHLWVTHDQAFTIQTRKPFGNGIGVVIDARTLSQYHKQFDVDPVWLIIAERNTWPNGRNRESCWRRSEGGAWFDGKAWKQIDWHKDTRR